MSSDTPISKSSKCPCDSGLKYIKCCGQYIKQGKQPATAEALMRSRYTAYLLKNDTYLLKSWYSSTRPSLLNLDDDQTEWLKLEILRTEAGNKSNATGIVEFVAYLKSQGQRQQLHEVSRFVREDNKWFYLDGDVDDI